MMKPDILVVTATLGDRESLGKTISSVASIGKSRVFHVIIAPKSQCISLQSKFPEVIIIPEDSSCKGIYPALNYALKKYAANFKFLTFINDDDYWMPDYSKLIEALDSKPEIDVVYGRVCYINEKNVIIGKQTSSSRYNAFGLLLSQNIILFTQQATLMKSDLFLKIGGFDESFKLVADTNFWLEAINSNAKFLYKNLICAAYMIQEGQLSSNGKLQKEEHLRLSLKIKSKPFLIVFIEKWLFRFSNFNIYFNRFIKNKKLIRMGQLFHK